MGKDYLWVNEKIQGGSELLNSKASDEKADKSDPNFKDIAQQRKVNRFSVKKDKGTYFVPHTTWQI